MSIFFRKEFYHKALSFFLTLIFLLESTLLPIATFLPQSVRAETIAQAQAYTAVFDNKGVNVMSGATIPLSTSPAGTTHGTLVVTGGAIHNAVVTLALPQGFTSPTVVDYQVNTTGSFVQQPNPWPQPIWQSGNTYAWTFGDILPGTYFLAVNFNTSSTAQAGPVVWTVTGTNMTPSPALAQQSVSVGGAKETAAQVSISMNVLGPDQGTASWLAQNSSGYTTGTVVASGGTMHSSVATLTLPAGFTSIAPDQFIVNNQQQPLSSLPVMQQSGNAYSWNFGDIGAETASLRVRFTTTAQAQSGTVSWGLTGTNAQSTSFLQQQAVGIIATSPATASITISRIPATSATAPFKVGDATVSIVNASPSFFTSNLTGTGYNQIGTNAPRTFSFSTFDLVNSGACNAQTGLCNMPGNWDAPSFACPAGVTGTQQMTEWYTVGGVTSNKITWWFQCSGTPSLPTQTPVGYLDSIDANGTASGWAVDPDSPSTSISVHFYIDGAAGQGGTYAGNAVANLPRPDLNATYPGNHGFNFSIPQQWRDGKPHTLYVHGIDLSGDGSKNVLLSNVPKSFTLGTVTAPTPALTVSPTTFAAGTSATITVANAAPNATVKVFCRDPNNVVCDDPVSYTTDASGQFAHTYDTTGWTAGAYRGWVTVGGVQSNTVNFTVTASTTTTAIPETTLSSYDFSVGAPLVVHVSGVPGGNVSTFCIDPNGVQCQDTNAGTIDTSGKFSKTYDTTGWTVGSYTGWATVNGVKSNEVNYVVGAATTTPPIEPATGSRHAPTPTTAPMATLTLERDQERVQPNQLVSFSGTLDASKVAFPQGSSLFIAIPEKTGIERIEIDDRALGAGEFSLTAGGVKVSFPQALYNGSHSFHIVLRNEVSSVPQLDRNIAVWVSVVGADSKLLLKGRTASTMMAHLPTEVIGKGVSLTVPNTVTGAFPGGTFCCSVSADPTHFPIRNFSLSETDITRGPFFTPNPIPLLPENIAFTMFPSDATMQRIGMSLKQFSDPLAREFITAQYQYLLGRDPSSDEMSRYLPSFMQWRNPLAALAEVYNRRADVRQAVLVPRDKNIGGHNDGSPLPSYDKLLEWAGTKGWQEEPSIISYKFQTGFDDGWKPFKELWEKYAPLVGIANNVYQENYEDIFRADATVNPVSAIAWMCYKSNLNRGHFLTGNAGESLVDFEFCWKNDPVVRNYAILWAKDSGWAFNKFVIPGGNMMGGGDTAISFTPPEVVTVSPDPILAPMFGPGKYPEYGAEQQWRYPPAQLYYDLISSPEYASFPEPRFRKNIDSVYRLFLGRPASAGDVDWVKTMFLKSNETPSGTYSPFFSWINPQWEPNGLLVASNYQYVSEVEFLTNPRYITDDVYGIRYIPGEIDAISSRLVEMFERTAAPELRQGDNFKRILSGLYRLYLRRNPTDAEVESQRASRKNFGDIEFALNQSAEYGKNPASSDAIKSLYRNYLGRDPNDADVSQWGDKTISTIANKIGTSAEMKSLAQAHPENSYIFPIKRIKIVKCGFFCSVFGKILVIALSVVASYVGTTALYGGFAAGISPAVSAEITTAATASALGSAATGALNAGLNLTSRVTGSISKGFSEAGFNGETFVQYVSIARAMAGQAGGVFSMTNLMENADPTILDGFRTMALAPQTPQDNAFAGLASPLAAVAGLFGARQEAQTGRIAQIDVSSHYGSGGVVPVSRGSTSAKVKSGAKSSTGAVKVTAQVSFTKTLSQGSRGPEVLKLQKFLGEADLTFLPEYRTGYYGAKTVAAVKRFQKRYGLEQTGSVGTRTRALLNSAR